MRTLRDEAVDALAKIHGNIQTAKHDLMKVKGYYREYFNENLSNQSLVIALEDQLKAAEAIAQICYWRFNS